MARLFLMQRTTITTELVNDECVIMDIVACCGRQTVDHFRNEGWRSCDQIVI